jgi:hypothetical protein
MKPKLIVSGTGRCGTLYWAKSLTSMGLNCGHESIFNYWNFKKTKSIIKGKNPPINSLCSKLKGHNIKNILADSSYLSAPYLNEPMVKKIPVIHIVRNPMKVISSFVKNLKYFDEMNSIWETFMCKHLPALKKINSPIERAAYYYIEWNKLIEKANNDERIYIFHRVEDVFKHDLSFAGINQIKLHKNTQENKIGQCYQDFYINQIPKGKIRRSLLQMANKYGYEIKTEIITLL